MTTIDALMKAVQAGDVDSIRELSVGADLDAQHEEIGTPLMLATAMQQPNLVALLLELGASPRPQHGPTSMTALHIAASNGNVPIAKSLLEFKASTEDRDNQGWTPLMFSIQERHLEMTQVLLTAGADIGAVDHQGRNALMLAANAGNVDAGELLIQQGIDVNAVCDWVTALILAASAGSEPMASLLLKNGARVDFLDLKEGYSALMMASFLGHAKIVEQLLAAGADVNLETEWFVTARTMAQRGGHDAIESLLAEHGAREPQPVPMPVAFPWGLVGDPLLCKKLQL